MKYSNALAVLGIFLMRSHWRACLRSRARKPILPSDTVILDGHVMDPESGLDAVRNIGIRNGTSWKSRKSLYWKQLIHAKGLVVAPGFIDMHEHGQEPRNYQFQAHDGVTTSLELEGGTANVADGMPLAKESAHQLWREYRAYSGSHSRIDADRTGRKIRNQPRLGGGTGRASRCHPEEIRQIEQGSRPDFRAGRSGGRHGDQLHARREPLGNCRDVSVAAKYNAPVHVHLRYAGMRNQRPV